jgi:IMP dehydrogenase
MGHVSLKELLSFDDVIIVPQNSDVPTRSVVSTLVELRTHSTRTFFLDVPVVSSPMDTVTEGDMIKAMAEAGGAGIAHRYNSIESQLEALAPVRGTGAIYGAAIGSIGDYIERCQALVDAGVSIIVMDVANGFNSNVIKAAEQLRSRIPKLEEVHFVVGNVAAGNGYRYLADTKLFDAIRCGIGGGSICTTTVQTGCGYPTLASVMEAHECTFHGWSGDSPAIIADGGIRTSGDVCKAIAAGADYVMLGSMLAGTTETPGKVEKGVDGKAWKVYRGMASEEAQRARGQERPRVEGVSVTVPFKGPVLQVIQSIRDGLQSACSMLGARNLTEFQARARFGRLSLASQIQSTAHIRL